jgi:peptidyl-prolyl cis-trans isomerase A (cyclophilin A)
MKSSLAFVLLPSLAFAVETTPPDPVQSHTISVEEATKGLKGTGTLTAKLEIEQAGKPMGTFTCELFDKQTPKTVANFVGLARGKRAFYNPKTKAWEKKPFYDGLTFHRVIEKFMIQGGDIAGTGTGTPGYEFEDETSPDLKMDKPGVMAMANRGPNTNGSQFFITEAPANWLNGHYNIFGQCDSPELVQKIARVPKAGSTPNDAIVIKKVIISRVAAKK